MQANRYLFNKKETLIVPLEREEVSEPLAERLQLAAAMLKNLQALGYWIKEEDLEKIITLSSSGLCLVYEPVLEEARKAKGADVDHLLLFRDFPEDVKKTDIDTLSDLRFLSYFTTAIDRFLGDEALVDGITRVMIDRQMKKQNSQWTEDDDPMGDEETDTMDEQAEMITIHLGSDDDFFDMVRNLLAGRASLSQYDRQLVSWTIHNFSKELYMPEKIVFKETQALLDTMYFELAKETGNIDNIDIKTLKDFKRLLASLSNRDVSLSEKLLIRKFNPDEERLLSRIFEKAIKDNYPLMMESMLNRRAERFRDTVLYGPKSRLHFEEKAQRRLISAFFKSCEKRHPKMHDYEKALIAHQYDQAAQILNGISPTLLIQHLRELAGKAYAWQNKDENEEGTKQLDAILAAAKDAAQYVNIKTLLNCEKELTRQRENFKFILPKGSSVRLIVKKNKSASVPDCLAQKLVSVLEEGIRVQIQSAGELVKNGTGTIYIDPLLKKCPIPSDGAKEAGASRAVSIGTHLPFKSEGVLRAWLYKQADHDQFIDFSCAFLNEDYQFVGQVSWNNLKEKNLGFHSGDTPACSGKGCTEVIDVDLKALKEVFPDAKYLAYQVLMWDRVPINSANRIFAAFSPTQSVGHENGKKLERNPLDVCNPLDVKMKIDIESEAVNVMPVLYDIDAGELIVLNIPLSSDRQLAKAAASNKRHFELPPDCEKIEKYASDFAMMCYAVEHAAQPTIADLAQRYALYGGYEETEKPEKADVIFLADRKDIADHRKPSETGEERGAQRIITPFDRDVIMGQLIPAPKTKAEQSSEDNA